MAIKFANEIADLAESLRKQAAAEAITSQLLDELSQQIAEEEVPPEIIESMIGPEKSLLQAIVAIRKTSLAVAGSADTFRKTLSRVHVANLKNPSSDYGHASELEDL